MAIIKSIGKDLTLDQAIDMFCDDRTLKAAKIHPLDQGGQSGIVLSLMKQKGQFQWQPDVYGLLESRYLLTNEPLNDSPFDVEGMRRMIQEKWPGQQSIRLGDSTYSVNFEGDVVIHAMPQSIFHGIGYGMSEILGTMGIHSTDQTEARYSRSLVEVVKKGLLYAVIAPVIAGTCVGIEIEDRVLQPLRERRGDYKEG